MTNREMVENNSIIVFEAEDVNDPAWELIISTLREHIPGFNVGYGKGNWMAFAIPNDMVEEAEEVEETDRPELADLAEIAIQENWSDDEFYNTAIDMGYTPMDFDDCVTATLQMREHGLGYGDGYDFVNDLHQKYGLLEAFRMGNEYLEMQKYTEDKDEIEFCKEVVDALRKLDQI